jgi:hypothetical protein
MNINKSNSILKSNSKEKTNCSNNNIKKKLNQSINSIIYNYSLIILFKKTKAEKIF